MGGVWPRRLGASSLVATLLAGVALGATAHAMPPTTACGRPRVLRISTRRVFVLKDDSRCLRVAVPLDRSGAVPGTVSLRVRIVPPRDGSADETIFALAGGPGQAAASLIDAFRSALGGPTLRTRELVTFDQRGTGGSGRLSCPELDHVPFDEADVRSATQRAVAACASRLGPARAHYTTADSVQDIEAVRAALGIDRIVLYGTSYGTKVALDYAAAYPQHVGKLLLDSVVPPEGVDPFERSTIAAIPSVLRAVCAGGACSFTPDAGADLLALGRRLARGPLRGHIVDGHGHARAAKLVSRDLYPLLLLGDLLPEQRALVPAAVRAALDGDPALLLRLVKLRVGDFDTQGPDSATLLLATRCEDGALPWAPGTPIDKRASALAAALGAVPPGQLAPFRPRDLRAFGMSDLCRAWPEAPVAQPRQPLPAVPTLILSGDEDLRTPRADALAVAARIPGARVLAVPGTGHSALGADRTHCARAAVTDFLAGREPRICHGARRDALTTPIGLSPRGLAQVRPLGPRRLPLRVRRTLGAIGTTGDLLSRTFFIDLIARLQSAKREPKTIRIGGLRGGCLVFGERRAVLRRYSVVPGVTLSEQEEADERGDAPQRLRIGGRAAARGSLRLGKVWTTGRLGGVRIRLRTHKLEHDTVTVSTARAAVAGLPAQPQLPPLPPTLRELLGWR